MKGLGWFALVVFLILLALLPVLFGQLFTEALIKLQLSPTTALAVVVGMFAGSLINIPVKRIPRTESVRADPFSIFGLSRLSPSFRRVRRDTIIAVNVGGCIIPVMLAIYETAQLLSADRHAFLWLIAAVGINTGVCFRMAKPIEGIGIAIPGLLPPVVAAASAPSSSRPLMPHPWPSLQVCSDRSSARISSTYAISQKLPPVLQVSASPEHLMGSCSQGLLRRI